MSFGGHQFNAEREVVRNGLVLGVVQVLLLETDALALPLDGELKGG